MQQLVPSYKIVLWYENYQEFQKKKFNQIFLFSNSNVVAKENSIGAVITW